MLIPLGHEKMTARRWPVVTFALIAINIVVFLATYGNIEEKGPELGQVKVHVLILAALHPELNLPPEVQPFVAKFKEANPYLWGALADPNREIFDTWDRKLRTVDDPQALQAEMDSLAGQYGQLSATSIVERYGLVPLSPRPVAYLTANFLHGGWLHLIGNMWFLWLAGFVLEDVWGRPIYTAFYLVAGVAALQFHVWTNAGSPAPTLGASGAIAALMGAFLVRFPRLKIEMGWVFFLRLYRFRMPAYWLLPMWLVVEFFYGAVGAAGGVAHWAHVGGFIFGAGAALGLRYSGVEHKMDQAIESQVTLKGDPEIIQADQLVEHRQYDEAIAFLKELLARKPDSVEASMLLAQAYWRKEDIPAYCETLTRLCALHLKTRAGEAAWHDYEDFLQAGGKQMPVATWLELCRVAENQGSYERALDEYQRLLAAHPAERQSVPALVGAARICLKRLSRPQDALRFYEAAHASPIPHLDWEQAIQAGMREARAALSSPTGSSATAGA